VVKPSDKALQVVLGPIADGVAGEIRAALSGVGGAPAPAKPVAAAKPALTVALPTAADDDRAEALVGPWAAGPMSRRSGPAPAACAWWSATTAIVDEAALAALDSRGVVRVGERAVHVVLGPDAERIGEAVRCLLPA
jgi:PTS system N-acetylglucosamine-specific IIC component